MNNELCAVISIKLDNKVVDIHRLIVHPNHFGKGMAQALLNLLESTFDFRTIQVATGSKNTPAVNFYIKNGFEKTREVTVNDQISLTFFEKSR